MKETAKTQGVEIEKVDELPTQGRPTKATDTREVKKHGDES